MSTLLLKNARQLLTMNDARDIYDGGALFVRDNVIEWVGDSAEIPAEYQSADRIIDASDKVVLPGLVNTHHHFYQTLTRALAPDSGLFDWLKTLYPIWARMDAEAVYVSTKTAMAELILSGCTTSSDHLYLFPERITAGRSGACRAGNRYAFSCGAWLDVVGRERRRFAAG